MKVRTIRRKDSKEFAQIESLREDGSNPMMFTGELPHLLGDSITLESLMSYYDKYHPENEIEWDEYEMVELDLVESGVVGSDIRDNLKSSRKLLALLGVYFDELTDGDKKDKLLKIIRKEMNIAKESIDYIAKIL